MKPAIATVYRTGGVYSWDDVVRLFDQLKREGFLDGREFICFTDAPEPHDEISHITLRRNWPGWWSKIELFAPWEVRDLLYFDLDTMVMRPMPELWARLERLDQPAILQDFWHPRVQSSMMWIPNRQKKMVWDTFDLAPDYFMRVCGEGGDQQFLDPFMNRSAARLQQLFPERIVSYKATLKEAKIVPEPASIVIFHGEPKPRSILWNLATA